MRGISNYSFMFNNMNSNKSNDLASTFNFSDLAAIRNGSYKKLVQKNLSEGKTESTVQPVNKRKITNTDLAAKTSTKIKQSVDALKDSANALNDEKLWQQSKGSFDTEKITGAIKNFVKNYNGVVEQADASNSSAVASSARWMNSLTDTMKSSLEKVGVKLGDDNKLTVDEEALGKADMKAVKSMFQGTYSYANQTVEKASSIASASLRDTSMYTSSGAYANMMSSWFNTSV